MRRALTILPLLLSLSACVHAQVKQQWGGTGSVGGVTGIQSNTVSPLTVTTGSCPAGTLNVAGYSCQLTATAGVPPYTWAITTGSLPTGLSLVGAAIIGTPITTAGVSNFQVKVTDSASTPNVVFQNLSISIGCPAVSILTPSTLPPGQQGTAFGPFQFQAVGGITPLTWTQNGGTLCSGMNPLSTSGVLSGTPTVQQVCTFGVQVADSCNLGAQTAAGSFTQQINTNIAVTTPPILPPATAGVFYQQTLSNSGGTGPYGWTLQAGSSLPGTLTLSTGGTLSGTVAIVGTYKFTVVVTDSLGGTAIGNMTLVVSCSGLNILTQSPLPTCTQGQVYPAFQMNSQGGFGAIRWAGPGLPAVGLNISPSGLITGTCTAIGVFNPTITATDSCSTPQTASGDFQLTMLTPPPKLVFADVTLQQATAGVPYNTGIPISGGVAPYNFTILNGAFQAGLVMSASGSVAGTATVAETDSPTVQVVDSGTPQQTASAVVTLTSVCPAISSTTTSIPPAKQGTAYSSQINGSGGYGTLGFSQTGLPTGMSISPTGLISGTPSASGSFPLIITITDQCSPTPQTLPVNVTLQVNTNLAITTASPLTTGQVGVSYSQSLTGSGGTPPYTWTNPGGGLPGGLSLSGANITGTPTTAGSFTFTLTLTDSVPNSVSATFTITINPATGQPALPSSSVLTWNTTVANRPTPSGTKTVCASGCDFTAVTQANLDSLSCGTTLAIDPSIVTSIAGSLTFNKVCDSAHWIRYVSRDAGITAEGTRISPCYIGIPPSAMPGIPAYPCTAPARHMPQFIKTSSGAAINVNCSFCSFEGLEFTRSNAFDLDFGLITQVFRPTPDCNTPSVACMNDQPTNVIYDRDLFLGDPQRQTTRAIGLGGSRFVAVLDSWCQDIILDFAGGGGDSQCFAAGTGTDFTNVGFYKFINNFVSAGTMSQLFGGAFVEPVSPATGFDGVPHDVWDAFWWVYKNPLWDTQIGQTLGLPVNIEGTSYGPAPDQALTVTPTTVQLATNATYQFQLLLLNDTGQGINRALGANTTATVTCGTTGTCGSVANVFTNVGTGIRTSQNQIVWTYTAPASIPSGGNVTVNFCTKISDSRLGTLGKVRTLCAAATVTITASPAHIMAVSPQSPNLRIQPSYSDSFNNTRQICLIFYAIPNFSSVSTTWAVDGVTGGNSTVGTIDTGGLYCSPSTTGTHTIKATASDSTFGTSVVSVTTAAPIVGFDLKAVTSKNGWELKEGSRVLFENSLIENCWGSNGNGGGQPCSAILMQPINQVGCPGNCLNGSGVNVGYGPQYNNDITVRYVKAIHTAQGLVTVSLAQALGTHRVSYANVLLDDMNYQRWGNGFLPSFLSIKTDGSTSTSVSSWTSLATPQIDHVTHRHVTLVGLATNPFDVASNLAQFTPNNLVWQDSIIAAKGSATFINGNGEANDCNTATGSGTNNTEVRALSKCSVPYVFNHLALTDSTAQASTFTSTPIWQPLSTASDLFANYNNGVGGDYRVCTGLHTPTTACTAGTYAPGGSRQASDGSALGADISGINAVEAQIRAGVRTP